MDFLNSEFFALIRDKVKITDNNMFVTNFVVYSILECYKLGTIQPDDDSFEQAVEGILNFLDKNQEPGVPIYTFWPQALVNNTWSASPKNLIELINTYLKMPKIVQYLPMLIFGPTFNPNQIAQMISAFCIPSDNDDSGLNIVLGQMLKQNQDKYPQLNQKWQQLNSNYKGFYEKVKHYSYRPFASLHDSPYNTNVSDKIDPRTYYVLQGFINQTLEQAEKDNVDPNLILFTTWLLNENEEINNIVIQPFHTNNVDVTVNANSLFGLNNILLQLSQQEQQDIFDNELRQMMRNVTNLLAWAIESNIINIRTDLALTYYPSVYDFYWFVARNVFLLNNNKEKLNFNEQQYCLETLQKVMKNVATKQLINMSKKDNIHTKQRYWQEFLGNYGIRQRHEDRLFSTAVALNALLDTWTEYIDGKLKYSQDIPQDVEDILQEGFNFLEENIDEKDESLENVFFSGSVKGFNQLPFWYPGNSAKYLNGTEIDPQTSSMKQIETDLIYAWKGFTSAEEYEQLVKEKWFKFKTPENFKGFNQPLSYFPFWSSPAITLSMSMLAMSKWTAIQQIQE